MTDNYWQRLEDDFNAVMRGIPRPVAPMPPSACAKRELPETRDDFSRDAESTGA